MQILDSKCDIKGASVAAWSVPDVFRVDPISFPILSWSDPTVCQSVVHTQSNPQLREINVFLQNYYISFLDFCASKQIHNCMSCTKIYH